MLKGKVPTATYYFVQDDAGRIALADTEKGAKLRDSKENIILEFDKDVWQHVKFAQLNFPKQRNWEAYLSQPAIHVIDDVLHEIAKQGGEVPRPTLESTEYLTVWVPNYITATGLENILHRAGIPARVRKTL